MTFIHTAPGFPDKSLLVITSGDDMWLARCYNKPEGNTVAHLLAQKQDEDITGPVYAFPSPHRRAVRLATPEEQAEWNAKTAWDFGLNLGCVPVDQWVDLLMLVIVNADDNSATADGQSLRQMLSDLTTQLSAYVPIAEVLEAELQATD